MISRKMEDEAFLGIAIGGKASRHASHTCETLSKLGETVLIQRGLEKETDTCWTVAVTPQKVVLKPVEGSRRDQTGSDQNVDTNQVLNLWR